MSESKVYSPSQLHFSFEKLLSNGGHAAAVRFLSKVSIEDVTAFLNDGSPFDGVKWWITRQPGYKGLGHTAFMRRYGLNHADTIPAFNAILKVLDNETYTQAQKITYCETYIKYAHESDRAQLEARIEAKSPISYYNEVVGGTVTEATVSVDRLPHPTNSPLPTTHGKRYPNIDRLANELGMYEQSQLWHILQRVADGSGKVEINTVRSFYTTHVKSTPTFYRVLNQGDGIWWLWDRANGRIWYRGLEAVGAMLGKRLPKDRLEHYRGTNAIGFPVFASLIGLKETYMQTAFAAWIEQRRKSESVTIANATLASIWKVDIRTIRRWKKQCGQRHNFTEQAPHIDKHQIQPDIPAHAVDTPAGGKLYQISSSYTPPDDVRKHNHRGRSRKARRVFYRAATITHQTNRLGSIWEAEERLVEKRYWIHDDIDTAFLQVDTTLRKPSSDTFLPRHILLQEKRSIGVWEVFTDTRQRVEGVYSA